MYILGIDPGPTKSACVLLDTFEQPFNIEYADKVENRQMLERFYEQIIFPPYPEVVAIEEVVSYGMRVGKEVFDTVRWSGRYQEAAERSLNYSFPPEVFLVPRREVKLHLCNSVRAKDADIRQALIDLYGGKEQAIGNKKAPGPLYAIKADMWQALALAITVSSWYGEKRESRRPA